MDNNCMQGAYGGVRPRGRGRGTPSGTLHGVGQGLDSQLALEPVASLDTGETPVNSSGGNLYNLRTRRKATQDSHPGACTRARSAAGSSMSGAPAPVASKDREIGSAVKAVILEGGPSAEREVNGAEATLPAIEPAASAAISEEAEERHMLGIFPMEIWTMILEALKDPNTSEQLHKTIPFFRDILEDKRTEFLFPEVFKILVARDCLRGGPGQRLRHRGYPNSDNVSHLELRKVCSSWSHGVDAYLEQKNDFQLPAQVIPCVSCAPPYLSYRFGCVTRWSPRDFMEHFKPTHSSPPRVRNPFLGRALTIRMEVSDVNLLNLYGAHVWFLRTPFDCDDRDNPSVSLEGVLKACPNLQCLRVHCWENNQPVSATPLPQLPKLQALRLTGCSRHIAAKILLACPSILCLDMDEFQPVAGLEQVLLPNLKFLQLHLDGTTRTNEMYLPDTPALSMLAIHADSLNRNGFKEWQSIFRMASRNWKSVSDLSEVYLGLPKILAERSIHKILRDGAEFRLELNVEKLEISIGCPCSLDLVLPMKGKLKRIEVSVMIELRRDERPGIYRKSLERGMKKQQIQFLGWERRLYESNIWSELPNLEVVIVDGDGPSLFTSLDVTERKWQSFKYTRKEWRLRNPQ